MNTPGLSRLMLFSVGGNLLLTIAKLLVGLFVSSASLVADGIHSLSDMVTDFVAWAGIRFSRRPPDDDHQYGHGKFETIAALVISLALLYVAWKIFFGGLYSLYRHEHQDIGLPVLLVALVSVLLKEWLFQITRTFAIAQNSPAMLANAWHHRSDAFSSVAVMLGALASIMGFTHGDQAASIVVGLMIAHSAWSILKDAVGELTEQAADDELLTRLQEILTAMTEVKGFHKLRSRRVGGEAFIDLHIQVAPLLSVRDSHCLTGRIKEKLREESNIPVNLLIHVEPAEETR